MSEFQKIENFPNKVVPAFMSIELIVTFTKICDRITTHRYNNVPVLEGIVKRQNFTVM